jgi:hypothetical protein
VKDSASGDGCLEHLFEAEGLGAELHVVVVPAAAWTAFIFDGIGFGSKLDQIGDADESEAHGAQTHAG